MKKMAFLVLAAFISLSLCVHGECGENKLTATGVVSAVDDHYIVLGCNLKYQANNIAQFRTELEVSLTMQRPVRIIFQWPGGRMYSLYQIEGMEFIPSK